MDTAPLATTRSDVNAALFCSFAEPAFVFAALDPYAQGRGTVLVSDDPRLLPGIPPDRRIAQGALGLDLVPIDAAEVLSAQGIQAEVIDLRSLRPLDMETVIASVARTHRALVVDEGWKTGSLSAEIGMQLAERAFFDLDAPLARVCSAEVSIPYAHHLEQAAIPQTDRIVAAALALMGRS